MANIFRIRPNGQLQTKYFIKPTYGSAVPSIATDFFRPVFYTIPAAAGSYTVSGQAVALKTGRLLPAIAGSYTVSGQAVALKTGRLLPATAGSYTVSGQAVALKTGRLLPATAGSYPVSGQAVALKTGRLLPATAGSYTVSGQAVALKTGRLLPATAGVYLVGGYAGLLYKGYLVTLNAGSFAVAGAVNFKIDRYIFGTGGTYSVTGETVDLILQQAKKLITAAGVFNVSGSAGLVYRKNIILTVKIETDIVEAVLLFGSPELTIRFKTECDLSVIFV